MRNDGLIELLKQKKEDIIDTIVMVASESLCPDFFGTYDIYLNVCDREIYVFMTESETNRIRDSFYYFLYSVKSNAVKCGESLEKKVEAANREVVMAEATYERILSYYLKME